MVSSSDELRQRFDQVLAELRELGDAQVVDHCAARLKALSAELTTPDTGAGEEDAEWHGMIGRCPQMLALRAKLEKFAKVTSAVMIRGESGTGKDLLARILHELSPRRDKPMVSENCAAIPESLLESVLFGHKRGAFTGAIKDHPGHFVSAHKGTLFLDEIGDMSLAMQAKLLRALQEGEVRPVGGEKVRKVDVRVLAATNRDLEAMVAEGSFRQDLFYRLNVLVVTSPPLRERGEDVILIAERLLLAQAETTGRELRLSEVAAKAIAACDWPGNIRQLQNELQRVAALSDGPEVGLADLSPAVAACGGA